MQKLTRANLQFEHETSLFILVSTLDLLMTFLVLHHPGFSEANPLALWFMRRWGLRGMVAFKFALVAVICLLTQAIARISPRAGRALLRTAVCAVSIVVIYSLVLLTRSLGAW